MERFTGVMRQNTMVREIRQSTLIRWSLGEENLSYLYLLNFHKNLNSVWTGLTTTAKTLMSSLYINIKAEVIYSLFPTTELCGLNFTCELLDQVLAGELLGLGMIGWAWLLVFRDCTSARHVIHTSCTQNLPVVLLKS